MKPMVKKLKWYRGVFILIIMFGFANLGSAEEFPVRPIEWITTGGVGGVTGAAMTIIGEAASKYLGQRVLIVPVPGGGTMLGAARVARAKPDGYTLLLPSASSNANVFYLRKNVPYRNSDFEFIVGFGGLDAAFIVGGNSPFKTLEDYLEFAKKNPYAIKHATWGLGSIHQLTLELFKLETGGLKIEAVPFKDSTEVRTAVLGGHVHAGSVTGGVGGSMDEFRLVLDGGGRILAAATKARLKAYPDVPTFVEKGINVVLTTWYGVAAPKGMPKEVSKKLKDAFTKALKDPQVIQGLARVGIKYDFRDGEEFTKFIAEYEKLIKRIVEEAKIAPVD